MFHGLAAARFSGFQVFTYPKMHDLVAGEGEILNGGLRAELPFPGYGKHRRFSIHVGRQSAISGRSVLIKKATKSRLSIINID